MLMGSGSTFAGDSSGEASLQLKSIALLDPTTGSPISGFSYSTDSGTQYDVNAEFVPEPAGYSLVSLGIVVFTLSRLRKRGGSL